MSSVPRRHSGAAAELSGGDLKAELAEMLGSRVVSLAQRPFAYRTSFAIQELDLALEDGRRLSLLLKDLGAPSDEALGAKPSFLRDPLREIEVYRHILSGRELGTAHCHGTVVDGPSGRYWLLLEHVQGVELWQVGELSVWEEVARWLALLHTTCTAVEGPRLLRYDRAFYETWLRRAVEHAADRRLHGVAAGYGSVVDRLVGLPVTFLHGEFYASNVLVGTGGDTLRVCPVDWEMAARGPALIDVVALTSGSGWSDAAREQIVSAYYDALPSAPSRAEFDEGLDSCRLHIALQWLGWASEWSPPSEHAQDWAAAALTAAGRLGLLD